MNEYLIIGIDDEYCEPVGIFSGNLIDILHKKFDNNVNYEHQETSFSIYRLDTLRKQGEDRYNRKYSFTKNVEVNALDLFHFSHDKNKEFLAKEIAEFNKENPNISVIVQKNGIVKFKDPTSKIKDEISKLSPETIEYIKSNGIWIYN